MGDLLQSIIGKQFPLFSLLTTAFVGVLYIQSGLDKITDFQGNLGWLRQHFGKSVFKNMVPVMFYTVIALELGAAILCVGGIIQIAVSGKTHLAFYGSTISAINLICLFVGQRFAKDYAGAATLVSYFILSLIGMMLCLAHL